MDKTVEELLKEALVPIEEQPYKVPKNWVWTYTPYLFDIEYGKNLPTSMLKDDGYPVFGANGQIGYYDEYTYEEPKVLISCRGANSGIVNISLEKSFITNNSLILNEKLNMTIQFIGYLFMAIDKSPLISGTAQPQITLKAFSKFPLILIPYEEQQRIVTKIESLFSKIDKAKELIEEAREGFENRKAAILAKAFRGELTEKWRVENSDIESAEVLLEKINQEEKQIERKKKDTFIGEENIETLYELPEKWLWVKLGNIFNLSTERIIPSEDETYPYIGLEHLARNGGLLEVGKSNEVKSTKTLFESGDILYGKLRPYLNKHYAVQFEGVCSTDILVFKESKYYQSILLDYYFNLSYVIRYGVENSNGINLPRVSGTKMLDLLVPLPPLEEQQEIVRILDNLLSFESEIKELTQLEEQIDLLKKSILAKAFRGELGTNDPTEESAIELLKEVL